MDLDNDGPVRTRIVTAIEAKGDGRSWVTLECGHHQTTRVHVSLGDRRTCGTCQNRSPYSERGVSSRMTSHAADLRPMKCSLGAGKWAKR